MKKIFAVFIVLQIVCVGYSQMSRLLINENFTGYHPGNLNTADSGQGSWKASFANSSADFVQVVSSAPLMYPGYTSGTQYINVKQAKGNSTEPDDPSKVFTNGMVYIHDDKTIFYISFLVRVPSAAGIASTGDASPNIALRTLNGGTFANFYIGIDSISSQLKFGIHKNRSEAGTFAPGVYNFNTTYLIVIRYDVGNGPEAADYDDKMYMWINPSLAGEPRISGAAITIDNRDDYISDGDMDAPAGSLQLLQEPASATASFDAFKVAFAQQYSTDETTAAAAWDKLSPAGMPLPVKFSDFKGYARDKRIELDWRVDFEYDVLRYEIERSTDGVSFSYAGSVAARNTTDGSSYTWMDAAPWAGNNYYRVKNVYQVGDVVYSPVLKLTVNDRSGSLMIYPNPAQRDHVSVQVADLQPGNYMVELFNIEGQCVYKKSFIQWGEGANSSGLLVLPPVAQGGLYTIQLTGNGFKQAKPLMVL